MNSPKDMAHVLLTEKNKCCGPFMKTYFPCLFCAGRISATWVFQRAPEPSDIFWENMNVHMCRKIFNIFISVIVTFIVMMISFGFISWIKSFKQHFDADFKSKSSTTKMSMYQTGVAKIMSFAASGAVVIINELLLFVMRRLSKAER